MSMKNSNDTNWDRTSDLPILLVLISFNMSEDDFKRFQVSSPRKLLHLSYICQSVEGLRCSLLRDPNETPKCCK